MVSNEKSFPRGGIANLQANTEISTPNVIFGATQKKIKKAPKPKDKQTDNENTEQLQAFSAESLTFDTLQEHMLVMGVVKSATATSLQIALPGRMMARALVADISDAYARVAQSYMGGDDSEYHDLSELFKEGRIVYGRAMKTDRQEGKSSTLLLTLKPADVNSSLRHGSIKKGFIFTGAIEEIQEHGCVIETGIQGLQAFMPNEDVAQQHHIGELIFLKVKQIQHNAERSTCQCIQLEQDKLKIKSQNETNLDYILPGSIVKFKVSKQLKNGLEGSIMNESFRGYVNEHYLSEALYTPQDYEVNEEYLARVLYVMPLTKLVYLTFNLNIGVTAEQEAADEEELPKKGTIVEKARVLRHGTGGIILLLNRKHKGLISYSSIKSNFKGNYDQDVVLSKYSNKSKHTVRVLGYDVIESLYYCTDNPNVVNEKLYMLDDLLAGDIVSARIVKPDSKIGGYCVKIGNVNGIIEQMQLAPNVHYEIGQCLRCRVLDICTERKICYLSNRSEYLSKSAKLLTTLQSAHSGNLFTGTVVKCEPTYILVKFCNGLKGVLHKQRLNGLMEATFFEGQTTKFRIAGRNMEQILLTLPEDKFQLGEICPVEITNTLDAGLEIKITIASDEQDESMADDAEEQTEDFFGLMPLRLLSDYVDLQEAQKRIYPVGLHIEAACIQQNIFSLRDVPYFSENVTKDWRTVQVGDVLRAHVKHATDQVLELLLPVRNYNKLVKLHVKMLCPKTYRDVPIMLEPDQLLYVKVLSKESETKTLTVSAKLTHVWSGQLSDTAKLVESYLEEILDIRKSLKILDAPIAKHTLGDKIDVIFKGVDPATNNWVYNLNGSNAITALLVASMVGTAATAPEVGSKQQAVILWIDYANDILLISNRKVDIEHISNSRELPQNLIAKSGMKAKVLLKLDSIVVCSLKKGANNPLVLCPLRLHPNDVENSASACLRQGDFCNLAFIHEQLPIAVPETVWKLWKGVKRAATDESEETPVVKKAKLESNPTTPKVPSNKKEKTVPLQNGKQKKNGQLFFEDKKPATKSGNLKSNVTDSADKIRLPGISSFWEAGLNTLNGKQEEVSSADEDDDKFIAAAEADANSSKKKRLGAKAKAKAEVKEEQRLRKIEERNADPSQQPETIDQFERLVIAEPNNSKSWIQYMSFLLSNTEIVKAREIARRAIKTIAFRETKELRNIWISLINLELSYNSSNFDDVLKEALSHNDPLETYLNLVDVLKSHNLKERLINTLNIIMRKFRTELQVWKVSADAYFWLGLVDRVQPTLQRALNVLPKNQHINCIVAFAKLYAQHEDNAMAQTLLDGIVTSYPKRIDIWVLYVDMLIKSGLIESARNVLERAVLQKLQPDKMLVIYKKYLDFEEKHGTEGNAARVKQLAEQYVQSQNKALK
ncbi:protein RRP5 homolog [Drosophila grimshawi]|uniref:GH18799 n=1 Tax=Drosophila grimshawi TaxID=7222 RepID=B4JFX2_DROGR|nr:protein RRP5 homolog [Drosophila grimshawi]EDV92511.1 GH18799 [Drosophila grimshawi]